MVWKNPYPKAENSQYSQVKQAARNMKTGQRSELVKAFLEEHGITDLELPSTGSLVKDMAIKLAIWKEKQEAMKIAMAIIQSSDRRALSWFNQLVDLNMKLVALEHDLVEKGINPLTDDDYVRAQELIARIRMQYDKMQFDLEKTVVERNIKNEDENVLFRNTVIDVGSKSDS